MNEHPKPQPRQSGKLWITTALLVVSVSINYIDRGNLSVAAPLVKGELGLSAEQLGRLLSAFFWSYAVCQLVAGWLVDRLGANWILAASFFFWSSGTAVTGLTMGFTSLLLMRLFVGVAEAAAYPCYSKILAGHFGENSRGISNALIDAGTKVGPALGTLLGGFFMAHFGWRPFFFALGLGALPWLAFWIRWMPREGAVAPMAAGEAPTVREILSKPAAWATFVGLFCSNYFWYFLLTWLPFYLVRERHFSMERMAVLGALPLIATATATTVTGWLSFRAIARGATPTFVRKTCMSLGLGVATVVVAVPLIRDNRVAMAILILASASYGIYTSSHWATTQTLAGPHAAGRWTGIQNFIGNLSGVAAPWFTGFVVGATGRFFWAFFAAAAIALIGSATYIFGLGRVEPVVWKTHAGRSETPAAPMALDPECSES